MLYIIQHEDNTFVGTGYDGTYESITHSNELIRAGCYTLKIAEAISEHILSVTRLSPSVIRAGLI